MLCLLRLVIYARLKPNSDINHKRLRFPSLAMLRSGYAF
nr:MAG TPA: hypothetical protein [Caudoviricetes sp.]